MIYIIQKEIVKIRNIVSNFDIKKLSRQTYPLKTLMHTLVNEIIILLRNIAK